MQNFKEKLYCTYRKFTCIQKHYVRYLTTIEYNRVSKYLSFVSTLSYERVISVKSNIVSQIYFSSIYETVWRCHNRAIHCFSNNVITRRLGNCQIMLFTFHSLMSYLWAIFIYFSLLGIKNNFISKSIFRRTSLIYMKTQFLLAFLMKDHHGI